MMADNAWSTNQSVVDTAADSHQPAVAIVADNLHAVWKQDRALWHAWLAEDRWSTPIKVAIGEHPALAVTPDGVLHCLFANWLLGNAEIYHVHWSGASWSLPEVISRTRGVSTYPAVAADANGALHAAWADTTSGRAVITYGRWEDGAWENVPIPHGPGTRPSLAVTPEGDVVVAWQNRLIDTGRFDIFSASLIEDRWSIPDNVSDRAQAHSICPQLATNRTGACHLVWQEEYEGAFRIRHADRRPNGWSEPADVSQAGADCCVARIAANRQGMMQVVWAEGQTLKHRARPSEYDAAWLDEETASEVCVGLAEVATAISPPGDLQVLWTGYTQDDARQLYHLRRQGIFKHKVFLPLG